MSTPVTRRTVPFSNDSKTIAPSQGGPPSSTITSDTRPAVPSDVIVKLLACTFAMVILPLGSYFFTLNFVFNGNSTYSGAFAAVMANVVLIVYIVLAMKEDEGKEGYAATGVDVLKRQVEGKKAQ